MTRHSQAQDLRNRGLNRLEFRFDTWQRPARDRLCLGLIKAKCSQHGRRGSLR